MNDVRVEKNEVERRYEAFVDGESAGFADYRMDDGVIEFPHTMTDSRFAGRGVASAMARASLDDARSSGLRVRPTCSFYASWIEKHPEYGDLVEA